MEVSKTTLQFATEVELRGISQQASSKVRYYPRKKERHNKQIQNTDKNEFKYLLIVFDKLSVHFKLKKSFCFSFNLETNI